MNIFQKVTLQSLKKNKVRTIVTIVGVILSAAMISAVTTFTASMSNYMLQAAIASEGAWHGYVPDADIATTQEIVAAPEVAEASAMRHLGYALVDGNSPYVYVLSSDEETTEMLSVRLVGGHYPTSGNEILLPEHLLNSNKNTFKIGDTITLALGQRMVDGYYLTQGNPYQEEETLEVRETRTFTVAGVYRRLSDRVEPYEAPGYVAITGPDGNGNADSRYDVFFAMNRPGDIYSFLEDHTLNGKTNDRVLLYSGTTDVSGFENALRGLSAIVIGLIMFGSISLIYNAFSISVSERTKQFGLLSSIGATRKQLRGMVLFEALVVSVIGIPIGILSGILGIGVTLLFVGDLFATLLAGEGVPMTLCISAPSILVAIVVALVTVLISAWIPSGRATKITAIEAIRQSRDIRPDKKVRRSSGLTYRLFGLPGVLASQHYRRSRKKYRATIFSLFMSIVLFVSASAFTDYMVTMAGQGLDVAGYDVSMSLRQ
ncbi:MAG TPA: ABC transporter permease, partial [Candidatus Avoscillospira avistercoris]|nr:ABC transporter permease [Candidatus Avoscillospira avistercoris]